MSKDKQKQAVSPAQEIWLTLQAGRTASDTASN